VNGEEIELVEVGDDTPTLQEQARLQRWKADIWNFHKAEMAGIEFFNPGLVRRPDGLWLLVRRSEQFSGVPYGVNKIWACKLTEPERIPHGGPILLFPNSKSDEQFEDPRAVYWNGQTWVACCNFTWFPGDGSWWTGAHQCLGVFRDDEEWTAIARRDPIVGTNKGKPGHTYGQHNKNFIWFFLDGKLHLVYTSDPWLVIEFGATWEDQIQHIGEGVKWKYGVVRGGTPPVQVDDLFYTFFHSSLHWRGRFRRYYMGAIAFEAKPPFKAVLWTQEPLLTGSQNDPWTQGKPLVVFPCGAILENSQWLISLGINDLKCGWIEIPHADILERLKPIPVMQASLLLAQKTPEPVYERIPFEEDLNGDVEGHASLGAESEPTPPASSDLAAGTASSENQASPAQNIPEKRKRGRPRKINISKMVSERPLEGTEYPVPVVRKPEQPAGRKGPPVL
jgi:predicted GH43/DUF377 family glycosyl hydrolase